MLLLQISVPIPSLAWFSPDSNHTENKTAAVFQQVSSHDLSKLKVIPGGQTIGVKMKAQGILVVGHHLVKKSESVKLSPGKEANLKLGDTIIKINDKPVDSASQLSDWVEKAGKGKQSLNITVLRNKTSLNKVVKPVFDIEDQTYRLGIYIRNSAAGVGTLTFYAPEQKVYGALGHVITDMDTQVPIRVKQGQIMHSNVTSIAKSRSGIPGEKRAHFFKESKVLGNIESNTKFGIFGKMNEFPQYGFNQKAIPVGLSDEVEKGPAKIFTVVKGNKVEQYDIEILHVSKQNKPATKGMIIKITDEKLLKETGGIVQGMSGSPIIQNGKLIGAVTHVLVNDPASGYGCFIEWMLQDAGIGEKSLAPTG